MTENIELKPCQFDNVAIRRFWSKVDKRGPDECWPWLGAVCYKGYGRFYANKTAYRAHRVAYIFTREVIPNDMVCDHMCRSRSCVNPYHIDIVDNATNVARGNGITAQNTRKTKCKNGHDLVGDNVYYNIKGSTRERACRQCRKRLTRESSERKKAETALALGGSSNVAR